MDQNSVPDNLFLHTPSPNINRSVDPNEEIFDRVVHTSRLNIGSVQPGMDPNHSLLRAVNILNRMVSGNTNKIPPPLPYDPTRGFPIQSFFTVFEKYAQSMYPQAKEEWSRVLPGFLCGEARMAFDSVDGGRLPYSRVREQLQLVFGEIQTSREDRVKAFLGSGRLASEPTKLFALRLEDLAVRAFPNMDIDSRNDLKKVKIQSTLPDEVQYQVNLQVSNQRAVDFKQYLDIVMSIESCVQTNQIKQFNATLAQMQTAESFSLNMAEEKKPQSSRVAHFEKNQPCQICYRNNHSTDRCYYRNGNGNQSQMVCDFCQRPNHTSENCYRRLGLCLICKKDSHATKDCPEKRGQTNYKENKKTCAFCDGSHLMKECAEFLRVLSSKPGSN